VSPSVKQSMVTKHVCTYFQKYQGVVRLISRWSATETNPADGAPYNVKKERKKGTQGIAQLILKRGSPTI
jgi:hypothetical protein